MKINEIKEESLKIQKNIERLGKSIGVDSNEDSNLRALIDKTTFDIAFVGEFTAGKSSILNALLGQDLLPTNLLPTTARITYISYSEKQGIKITFKDGSYKHVEFDIQYLKLLAAKNPDLVENIDKIEIFLDNPLLKDNIRLIDTPGTNDTDINRVEITYNLLPRVDAVIYVSVYPVTASNLEVFRTHIAGNRIKNLFVVLNKIDLLGVNAESAINDALHWFDHEMKINSQKFFAVSTADYLEGMFENEKGLIEKSRFRLFEEELKQFIYGSEKFDNLREHYDALLNDIKKRLMDNIRLKISGLSYSDEDFDKKKKELNDNIHLFKGSIKDLTRDVDDDFDKLMIRIQESLDMLENKLIIAVKDIISEPPADVKQFERMLENRIKEVYYIWETNNFQIIESYITSIKEEVSVRLIKTGEDIILALENYNNKLMIPAGKNNLLMEVLNNKGKSAVATSAAVVTGMFILTAAGLFAPLAFLLYPLLGNAREKLIADNIKSMEPQILKQLRENFQNFKNSLLSDISAQQESIHKSIDSGAKNYLFEMEKQISGIEIERQRSRQEIDEKIKEYQNVLVELSLI